MQADPTITSATLQATATRSLSHNRNKFPIGTVKLTAPTVFLRNYDYVLYFARVSCPTQEAILYANQEHEGSGPIETITVEFSGEVVEAYPSRKVGTTETVSLVCPADDLKLHLAWKQGALPPYSQSHSKLENLDFELHNNRAVLLSALPLDSLENGNGSHDFELRLVFKNDVEANLAEMRANWKSAFLLMNGQPVE